MKAVCNLCHKAVPGNMRGQPYKHNCVPLVDNSVLSPMADTTSEPKRLREENERLKIMEKAQNLDRVGLEDYIEYLKSEKAALRKDWEQIKAQYAELVDALCSPAWMGRNRHSSVVALAKRLHDSQTKLRPLELEDIALAAGYCIRKSGHEGSCNGLPRNDCHNAARTKERGGE